MTHKTNAVNDMKSAHKAEPLWWVRDDWPTLLRNHWSWAAPLLYIMLAIVGMVLSWLRYDVFGINIFEFGEMNDFLLAAIREPAAFMMLVVFLYMAVGVQLRRREALRLRTDVKQGGDMALMLLLLLSPFGMHFLSHGLSVEARKDSYLNASLQKVEVSFKTNRFEGEQNNLFFLIGTTGKYAFFYDKDRKETVISPLSNLLFISKREGGGR